MISVYAYNRKPEPYDLLVPNRSPNNPSGKGWYNGLYIYVCVCVCEYVYIYTYVYI